MDRTVGVQHLAGRIACEVCFPHPDAANRPPQLINRIADLITSWPDFPTALGALAVAGPLVIDLRGHTPDIDTAAVAMETGLSGDEMERIGFDIGIGFTRSSLSYDTVDQAILFLVDTIGDPELTQPQRNAIFLSALSTIIALYTAG